MPVSAAINAVTNLLSTASHLSREKWDKKRIISTTIIAAAIIGIAVLLALI